jgi:hypothetical protein
MKTWIRALLVPVVAFAIALQAHAGQKGTSAYERLDRQQAAIDRGVDSGALTKREAGILRQEQREIRELARRLHRDGSSPRDTRRILDKKLDQSDRHIRRLTSNDEVRYSRNDHRGSSNHRANQDSFDSPRR